MHIDNEGAAGDDTQDQGAGGEGGETQKPKKHNEGAAGDDTQDQGAGGEGGETQKPKKRAGSASTDPRATLGDDESLRNKTMEVTLDSDPLFRRTSKLFDEGSAAGGWW
eukprot:gene19937-26644_t